MLLPERAVAVPQPYGFAAPLASEGIRNKIGYAVSVKVGHRQRGVRYEAGRDGERLLPLERAVTVAQQDAHTSRDLETALVYRDEIGLAVPIDICDHHFVGGRIDGESPRWLEGAVAVAQQHTYI